MFRPRQIGRIGDRAFGRRPLVSLVHTDHCGGCAPGQDERILVRTIFAYVAIFRSDLLWLMCILQFIYFPAGDTVTERDADRRRPPRGPARAHTLHTRRAGRPPRPVARRRRAASSRRPSAARAPLVRPRDSSYAVWSARTLGRALFRAGSKLLRRTGWDHPSQPQLARVPHSRKVGHPRI